jgi:hypothetical protein
MNDSQNLRNYCAGAVDLLFDAESDLDAFEFEEFILRVAGAVSNRLKMIQERKILHDQSRSEF